MSEREHFEQLIGAWFEDAHTDVCARTEKQRDTLSELHECKMLTHLLNIQSPKEKIQGVYERARKNPLVHPAITRFIREWEDYRNELWKARPPRLRQGEDPGLYDRLISRINFVNVFTWHGYTRWLVKPKRYCTLEWTGEKPMTAVDYTPTMLPAMPYTPVKLLGYSKSTPRRYAELWMKMLWPHFHARINSGLVARMSSWAKTLDSHAEHIQESLEKEGYRRIPPFRSHDFAARSFKSLMESWMGMLQDTPSYEAFLATCNEEVKRATDAIETALGKVESPEALDLNRFKAFNVARDVVSVRHRVVQWLAEARDIVMHVADVSTDEKDQLALEEIAADLTEKLDDEEAELKENQKHSRKMNTRNNNWRNRQITAARDADVFMHTRDIANRLLSVLQSSRLTYLDRTGEHEMPESEQMWRSDCADMLRAERMPQPLTIRDVTNREDQLINETKEIIDEVRKETLDVLKVMNARVQQVFKSFKKPGDLIQSGRPPRPELKPPVPKDSSGNPLDRSLELRVSRKNHDRLLRMLVILLKDAEDTDPDNPGTADTWVHHVSLVRSAVKKESPENCQYYWDLLPSIYALFVWQQLLA